MDEEPAPTPTPSLLEDLDVESFLPPQALAVLVALGGLLGTWRACGIAAGVLGGVALVLALARCGHRRPAVRYLLVHLPYAWLSVGGILVLGTLVTRWMRAS